ncbi:MAG: NPCBM/NEW2 domain-containing protein [Fibrobacterales bacterium]
MNTPIKQFLTFNRTGWTGLIYASIIVVIAGIIFQLTDTSAAKAWDLEWSYEFMVGTALIMCLGFILNARDIIQRTKQHLPNQKSLIVLGIIVLFFGGFTWTQIEKQHRVLSDETSWESMAINMHFNGRAGTCNQGYYEEGALVCTDEVNNFKGKASGLANKIAFSILGDATRDQALQVNYFFYIASILLLFYGFFLATKNESIALIATIFFASFPTMMFQSQTATTEVMYVFLFAILLVVVQLFHNESPTKGTTQLKLKHFVLIIPLLGFFAQTRQETVFCILPFVFYFHTFFKQKSWYLPAFTFLVLLASLPVLNTICAYKGYGFQGGEYDAHSFWNLTTNLWTNVEVMLNWGSDYAGLLKSPWNTTVAILLYLGAIYLTARVLFNEKYRWGYLLVLAYQLQAIVIMVNVSGNFTIGINQRYVLVAFPSFALILGIFLHDVSNRLALLKTNPLAPKIFGALNGAWIGAFIIFTYHKDRFFSLPSDSFFGAAIELIWKVVLFAALITAISYVITVAFKKISNLKKPLPQYSTVIAALALMTFLTLYHHESFTENIQYRRNKLLTEEAVLNIELKNLPKNAIYIYSRPWQMLAQGLNAFSESKILRWSDAEYAKWKEFSNDNIYIVRGQDGFGTVNKKSRVVGFKTTDKVTQILEMFETKEVYKNSKDFGYPLSVTQLKNRKGRSPFQSNIYIEPPTVTEGKTKITIRKKFDEAVTLHLSIIATATNNEIYTETSIQTERRFSIPIVDLQKGMHTLSVSINLPDSTQYTYNSHLFNAQDAQQLTNIPAWKNLQSWGSLGINKSVMNNELTIDGKRFSFGFGSHSFSSIQFKLNGKYTRFYSKLGLDDEDMCGDGIVAKIFGDDRLLFTSDTLHAQELATLTNGTELGIDITRVQTLRLVTDSLTNKSCDHINWVNPWLE